MIDSCVKAAKLVGVGCGVWGVEEVGREIKL